MLYMNLVKWKSKGIVKHPQPHPLPPKKYNYSDRFETSENGMLSSFENNTFLRITWSCSICVIVFEI